MTYILSLETATKVCSVALHHQGKLLALKESFVPNSHSEYINGFIEKVLAEAKVTLKQLQAICISAGPGSYTGLRIGTSTAKGLCYALRIPLLSIHTLQGLALQYNTFQVDSDTILCPMLDARRMEVYCALYNAKGEEIVAPQAKIIEENSFLETLKDRKMLCFGDGAMKCAKVITHENAMFRDGVLTTAKSIGQLAYAKFVKEEYEDLAYFEPFYVKEFHTVPSKKNLLQT